jgi:hypothetical protein
MKSLSFILSTLLLVAFSSIYGQTTEAESKLREQQADTVLGWKRGGIINMGLSQTSLTNWAAGGQNSLATNGILSVFAHKRMKRALWENYLDMGYGLLKQGNDKRARWMKTDDKVDITSKYGHQTSAKWYIAGLLNFKTQITQGFNYPNDSVSVKISNFLAPAYGLAALGMEYKSDGFSAFIAPLTTKVTIVADQSLADAGAFGVEKAKFDALGNITSRGKNVREEFGGYVKIMYKKNIMKNVTLQTKADFFSNYLHNAENIDVNWETLLSLKVNKYISTTVSTSLIYDDDIIIAVDKNKDGVIDGRGPRVQFKEILNVGFSYKF